ncbi:hypothetical protein PIB30_027073 [Stylosanthes scabra]|uniref:Choline transporter-like protein n=1 Tax=Stylosanthes scabra TaxID=79078 RepID=A0ABU6U9E6_9FABA|nr:hypothetical protein [Stylosanthes scabra]
MATQEYVRITFQVLFYLHLLITAALVVFIPVYGLTSDSRSHNFHPLKWYLPILASTACGGVIGFMWQWITFKKPRKALRATFWFTPLLTSLMAAMFVHIGTSLSLVVGTVSFLSAVAQSFYGCCVSSRFEYATNILSLSIAFPSAKSKMLALSSILIGVLYCCFLVFGIGGATAIQEKAKLAYIYILVIMLSLCWTMQFLKNVIQVTISRVAYLHILEVHMDANEANRDTIKNFTGCVAMGSILVPVMTLLRSFARLTCCCVGCYMTVSSVLMNHGNRWGFVHVGVYNHGFLESSYVAWDMFTRVGMLPIIDSDLTGSLCFLSGVAVGAICSMLSGMLSLLMHQSYAMDVSIYAFFIGYFMCRLAMGWLQACVSAYYVAYAENPMSNQFDSTIPDRLEEIKRSRASSPDPETILN